MDCSMRRPLGTVFIAAFAVVLAIAALAAGDPPVNPGSYEPLPPELNRALRDYERAWRAKDASALADLFAEDGFVLSDGSPPAKGREAIRRAYANAGGPLWLRSVGHATDGDVGYIIGVFGHKQDGAVAGEFIFALRPRARGPWFVAGRPGHSIRPRKLGQRPGF